MFVRMQRNWNPHALLVRCKMVYLLNKFKINNYITQKILLGIDTKELKMDVQTETCTRVFATAEQ